MNIKEIDCYGNEKQNYYRMGKQCFPNTALLATLIALKPKYCLEIGTNKGDKVSSSQVFFDYFNYYQEDGYLITTDIKIYEDHPRSNISKLIVYPHTNYNEIKKLHNVNKEELLPDFEVKHIKSVENNIKIISNEMDKLGIELFDFAYIDGDHEQESFRKDLEICLNLVKDPRFILCDDVKDPEHPCCIYFREKIKNNPLFGVYEFEDWDKEASLGLLWIKE
jgi:hypothetical protein